jgi:hypothetical protein
MNRSRRQLVSLELPGNWAELLFAVGGRVRKQIKRGAGLEEVSKRFESTPDYCELALTFFRASDLLKLRAMVEDWPLERIACELGRPMEMIKREG